MKLEPAREQQAEEIYRVVQQSIKTSYPQYYSAQVVDFFCALHNREAITEDYSMRQCKGTDGEEVHCGYGKL